MRGYCNCGAITFRVSGPTWNASACHCGQCRRQSGYHWSSAVVERTDIRIEGAVRWYASSEKASRGFCPTCGSFLFWRHADETSMSFALGALEAPTGIRVTKHIFAGDKGDYYDIADGLPQEGL